MRHKPDKGSTYVPKRHLPITEKMRDSAVDLRFQQWGRTDLIVQSGRVFIWYMAISMGEGLMPMRPIHLL
jgi:hypothetical protein